MCYELPKIWQARIQKYWDKILPTGYPSSSSEFNLKFETPEIKAAVDKFEAEIGTDESVVKDLLPEGTVLTNYVGVYDVVAEPETLTLLFPEKVNENAMALHYNAEDDEWSVVEDTQIINGYIWGQLDSFSPIAVVEYRKEIHLETQCPGTTVTCAALVCEGNFVKIVEEDGVVKAINSSTGKEIELTGKTYIVGGSIDGTPIESTNVFVQNTTSCDIVAKIIGGSVYIGEGFTTVGTVNVNCVNCVLGGTTGSFGAVRTDECNITIDGCTSKWIGMGEGYAGVDTQDPSFASRAWLKQANLVCKNTESQLTFCSGNCEYYYVSSNNAVIEGGSHDYLVCGGSNDKTDKSVVFVKDANIGIFQTTNRGTIADAKVLFTNCKIENLYVGGDASDSTVTGTTGKLRYEINNGADDSYSIVAGTEAGVIITKDDVDRMVDAIKVSRSVNITISDEVKNLLGAKYIIK